VLLEFNFRLFVSLSFSFSTTGQVLVRHPHKDRAGIYKTVADKAMAALFGASSFLFSLIYADPWRGDGACARFWRDMSATRGPAGRPGIDFVDGRMKDAGELRYSRRRGGSACVNEERKRPTDSAQDFSNQFGDVLRFLLVVSKDLVGRRCTITCFARRGAVCPWGGNLPVRWAKNRRHRTLIGPAGLIGEKMEARTRAVDQARTGMDWPRVHSHAVFDNGLTGNWPLFGGWREHGPAIGGRWMGAASGVVFSLVHQTMPYGKLQCKRAFSFSASGRW